MKMQISFAKFCRKNDNCFRHFLRIALIWAWGNPIAVTAQHYLGLGFHLTPPVYLEHTQNPNVVVRPQAGLAGSLTYKREWAYRKRQKWYAEAGLTTQGLRYKQVNYTGDSVTIWSDFQNRHVGFPSILLGGGHSFGMGSNGAFSIGLEASLLIAQDLDEIGSYTYTIFNDPMRHKTTPVYLRLNLAYNHTLQLFRSVTGQLQIYTNLSPQKLTKGTQYILNIADGGIKEGTYAVNNSEIGVKLFANLNKKTSSAASDRIDQNALLAQREKKVRYRISLAGQLFAPSRTVYHIPRVDSFSVKSKRIITNQLGVVVELPHRNNDLWSTVIGLGIGPSVATLIFKSDGAFPSDKAPVEYEYHIDLGHYAIVNLGLSRRYALKRLVLAHTLTASVVLPLEKTDAYLGVPLGSTGFTQPPPFANAVLEGSISDQYGREKALFGIEYNPEIIFKWPEPFFIALGLVANYSRGVIAQGRFTVSNDQTTYYGALIQGFSKFGVTMRIGLEQ